MLILIVVANGLIGTADAQKGDKSIAAGLLVGLPENDVIYEDNRDWDYGVGLEGVGQLNFTDRSAALLQIQLTRFSGYSYNFLDPNGPTRAPTSALSLSLKAGYRYQFTKSGFFANLLAGVETNGLYSSAALGIGKRITVKEIYFLDVGIDYSGGFVRRYNIKAVFSIVRRSKID
ncbi:hypothetical protein BUE76_07705 [Cnuella takakiae]|nr:hypothetical protein BUE76_07705 [Cnuella takakiae]